MIARVPDNSAKFTHTIHTINERCFPLSKNGNIPLSKFLIPHLNVAIGHDQI